MDGYLLSTRLFRKKNKEEKELYDISNVDLRSLNKTSNAQIKWRFGVDIL